MTTSPLEIEPARAKAKDPTELWDDPEWIAEEKIDGWRFMLHVGESLNRPHLTGRRTSSVTGKLSEKGLCVQHLWPADWDRVGYSVFDGEVIPPVGRSFGDLAGVLNVDPADAEARMREIGYPRYVIFDVLFVGGEDVRELSYAERRHCLDRAELDNDLIVVADSWEDRKLERYEEIVSLGGEGVVLKNICSPYGDGWVKVKRHTTLDVIVSGFKPGRGKYFGQVGALLVSVLSTTGQMLEVGAVSGMDDATRLECSRDRAGWINTVVEIRAQEWAKDRLRHPRFVRRRPEARVESCTFQKMRADLDADGARSSASTDRQGRLGL